MCAFVYDRVFDPVQPVEDHSPGATFDVVDGRLSQGEAEGDGNGILVDCTERLGHVDRW